MKLVINSLTEVPETIQGEYESRDGKFYLKMEGEPVGYVKAADLLSANAKVVEFRDKNIALLKENDELRPLKLKYEGIDPEAAKEALSRVAALGKKGIKDADDFDARVKAMVDEVVKPLREQVTASAAETLAERQRADEFLLSSKIGDQFVKAGGKPGALEFVTGLAQKIFEVKDKAVVAKTGKFSVEKLGDPISVDEWIGAIAKEHDYVFVPSAGGGATTIKGSGGSPTLRAGQTLLKNPTPQELGQFSAGIAKGEVKVVYDSH